MTVIIGCLLVFFSYWVRAIRFYDYFHSETQVSLMGCFKVLLQLTFFNHLLPMRSGEISFPLLMFRYFRVPATRSASALLWFRILDLHSIIILGFLAVWKLENYNFIIPLALLIWTPIPWFIFLLRNLASRYFANRLETRLTKLFDKALSGLPNSSPTFWRSWVWTLIIWLVKLSTFTWVFLQFLDVPLIAVVLGVIAGDLSSILPIHAVAGAGTYEAGVASALLLFGISLEQSIPAAVNLHLFVLVCSIIGMVFAQLIPLSSNP
jgi:uncharacterized membrane protein YbhN (UPF0104 family)